MSRFRNLKQSLTFVAAGIAGVGLVAPTFAQEDKPAGERPATVKPVEIKKPVQGEKSEVTLKVGDKAPALSVEKWVKGKPIKAFEPGKVYVVEFWATWCGPCVQSMPHLSKIQTTHKDKVTIIGLTSEDPNNSLSKVEEMVTGKGDGIAYTIAWDKGQETKDAFFRAAGQNGIPCSFLVDDKGTIAWIGHPMFLDVPIELMVAGKWDAKTGPEAIAKAEAAVKDVWTKARSSPKDALAAYDTLAKDYPGLADHMSDMPFSLAMQARDYATAYKYAGKIVDTAIAEKNSAKLNEIAWNIVDPDADLEKRDLDLAMKAAVKADEFTGSKDAAIIDTLARVYFWKGDLKKAIELQTKAVENAKGQMLEEVKKSLEEYKKKAEKKE